MGFDAEGCARLLEKYSGVVELAAEALAAEAVEAAAQAALRAKKLACGGGGA